MDLVWHDNTELIWGSVWPNQTKPDRTHIELCLTPFKFDFTMIKPGLMWGLVWPHQTKPDWAHIGLSLIPFKLNLTMVKPSPPWAWFDWTIQSFPSLFLLFSFSVSLVYYYSSQLPVCGGRHHALHITLYLYLSWAIPDIFLWDELYK